MADPLFRPVADHALLVEFGDRIDSATHDAVLRLDQALAAHPFPGLHEAIPAFVNLLVSFDPLQTDHAMVETHLRRLIAQAGAVQLTPAPREVLICYDPPFAPDLAEVAQRCGLTPEAVIAAHLAAEFEVYLYGFAPGYAYMAGLPAALRLDRKSAPVRGVAAGSVLIAGAQCLVSTLVMPTGWWIIGRSPTPILTGDAHRPFLFDVGDRVRFRRIGADQMGAQP
ncbi:MAG: allophanate hydrolase subunit 1 [Gemmobacter sp.]|nr:allophanate hydrolase subunit 1 [Gemmobacter sp.]